jgi:hypothetical protein
VRGKGNDRASERQGQGTSSFGLKKGTITESTSDRQPSTTSTSSSGWMVGHKRNHRENDTNRLYPSPPPSIPNRDESRRRPTPLNSRYVTGEMLSSIKDKEPPIVDFANLPPHPAPRSQVRPSLHSCMTPADSVDPLRRPTPLYRNISIPPPFNPLSPNHKVQG